MKLKLQKLAIMGLVIMVAVSAVFCCCLTDFARAETPVPSCHEAHQQNEPPQDIDECDCDQSVVKIENQTVKISLIELAVFSNGDHQIGEQSIIKIMEIAYHAPPVQLGLTPLYIRNSTLLI